MTLITEPGQYDPLRNLPSRRAQIAGHTRRHDDAPISTARQIVVDFLRARLAANNARIAFLLDPTPENMTAWADAENAALGDEA